eukprot:scaffold2954_cov1362-Pavlova_lutheri.AAC.1
MEAHKVFSGWLQGQKVMDRDRRAPAHAHPRGAGLRQGGLVHTAAVRKDERVKTRRDFHGLFTWICSGAEL